MKDKDGNETGGVTIKVTDLTGDEPEVMTFTLPPELQAQLEAAQKRWAELAEAGTPYWCVHEGRSVTHDAAYWQDDQPGEPIHRKHGVRCHDCGGYIQEG